MVGMKKPTSGLVSFTYYSSFNLANSCARSLRATCGLAWPLDAFIRKSVKALSALRLPDLKSATAASLSAKTWWIIGIKTAGYEIWTIPAFSTYSCAPPPFLARWTKTFLVVAELFKKDMGLRLMRR